MFHLSLEYKFSTEPTANRLEHPLLEILESVQETGSIGKAAKQLGRSYRHVWGELKFWALQLDANLVTGGKSGKAAKLTIEAKHYLKAMRQSQKELSAQILQIKKQVLKNTKLIEKSRTFTTSASAVGSLR